MHWRRYATLMGGSSNAQHIPHRVYICSISHVTHNTQNTNTGQERASDMVHDANNKSRNCRMKPYLRQQKKAFSQKPST